MEPIELPAIAPATEGRELYAVVGNPVAHSKSPFIHARFAGQTGEPVEYRHLLAPIGGFADTVRAFIAARGRGLNVTVPFKLEAHGLADRLSARAEAAGAVNTLRVDSDGLYGDNTDGVGLVRDIESNLGVRLAGARILLLGAGGAARATAFALLDAGVDELIIVNRTPERADALADSIGDPKRVYTRYWDDLGAAGNFDLIVNATSAGLGAAQLALPFGLVARRTLCYDLSYGAAAFAFLAWARAAGAGPALDGLGMLVEQAAESFAIWHGVRPDTDAVHAELRAELPLRATD